MWVLLACAFSASLWGLASYALGWTMLAEGLLALAIFLAAMAVVVLLGSRLNTANERTSNHQQRERAPNQMQKGT